MKKFKHKPSGMVVIENDSTTYKIQKAIDREDDYIPRFIVESGDDWEELKKDHEGAKQFIFDKLSIFAKKFVKREYEDLFYYKENGKTIFILNSETKEFWFDFYEMYVFLGQNYSFKYNEIKELMVSILEEYFKVKDYSIVY